MLFSNLAFVRQVNQVVVQRLKLKQWLLLATRLLAFLAIICAFAQPFWGDSTSLAQAEDKSVLIILDNSSSMMARDDKGIYFQQALALTQTLLDEANPNDEYQLVTTGRFKPTAIFQSAKLVKQQLAKLTIQDQNRSLGRMLDGLDEAFREARNRRQLIYLISDFQFSTLLRDSISTLKLGSDKQVVCLPVGGSRQKNCFISRLELKNLTLERGRPVSMFISCTNEGETDAENQSLKLSLDGEVVALSSLNIPANQTQTVELTFTPKSNGWLKGSAEIDDMENPFDNIRYFSLHIPEKRKLLIVEGKEPTQYLKLITQNILENFTVKTIPASGLSLESLEQYDALVLADMPDFSAGLQERIRQFVQQGGGLVVFPGANAVLDDYTALYRKLELGTWTPPFSHSPPMACKNPDLSLALYRDLFLTAKANADFDGPLITKKFGYQPTATSIQQTALTAADGSPVLVEQRLGEGRVFTYTLFPSLAWSDFPLKSSFVPLVIKTIGLAATPVVPPLYYSLAKAEPVAVQTDQTGLARLVLAEPRTEVVPPQQAESGYLRLIPEPALLRPGVWEVQQNDSTISAVAFNLAEAESSLIPASRSQLQAWFEEAGIRNVTFTNATVDNVRASAREAGFTAFGWSFFLWLAVFFLVLEVAILKLIPA